MSDSQPVGAPPMAAGPDRPTPPPAGRRNEWLLVSFTATTNTADAVIKVALPLLAAAADPLPPRWWPRSRPR